MARPERISYGSRTLRPSRLEIALAALAVILLGVIAAQLLLAPGGPKSEFDGFVYVESNDAQSGQNTVLAYTFRKNGLHFIGDYEAGNQNTHDVSAGLSNIWRHAAISGVARAFTSDGYFIVPENIRGPADTRANVRFDTCPRWLYSKETFFAAAIGSPVDVRLLPSYFSFSSPLAAS